MDQDKDRYRADFHQRFLGCSCDLKFQKLKSAVDVVVVIVSVASIPFSPAQSGLFGLEIVELFCQETKANKRWKLCVSFSHVALTFVTCSIHVLLSLRIDLMFECSCKTNSQMLFLGATPTNVPSTLSTGYPVMRSAVFQRLATALYEAATDLSYVNPQKVRKFLGVSLEDLDPPATDTQSEQVTGRKKYAVIVGTKFPLVDQDNFCQRRK